MQNATTRLLLVFVMACADPGSGAASHLEVTSDTLVLYGADYSFIPVRLVDAAGGASQPLHASVSQQGPPVLSVLGTRIACERAGRVPVHVALDDLRASFVAVCRPAARLRAEPILLLRLDDPPVSLPATAVFENGDTVRVHPIEIASSDTTVVAVRGDHVVALDAGFAGLTVDYGGLRSRVSAQVEQVVINDTVVVGSGEVRQWELTKGRYKVTVRVRSPRDLAMLSMETDGANCARDFRDEDTINCVVADRATLTLRNASTHGDEPARRTLVSIWRF